MRGPQPLQLPHPPVAAPVSAPANAQVMDKGADSATSPVIPRFVVADTKDTLARIAAAWGASPDELRRLNPGLAETPGRGVRVRLPEEGLRKSPVQAASHRVSRGETLVSIARQHGLDAADLKAWNRLSSSRLKPGQRLRLSPR